MKVHEYWSRSLLADAGVPVPPAEVISTVEQACDVYETMGGRVVVKAQVLAGGRGKAGFVRLCSSLDEVRQAADFMLTHKMVSRQTGPEGVAVKRLLIASAVDIESEYYVAVVIDRPRSRPVAMVSREGGVEIEEVAAKSPDAIVKEWLHPHLGLQRFQAARLARALGFTDLGQLKAAERALGGVADVFVRHDASLVEINPLVRTTGGDVLAIDAKIVLDDNAAFRHPEREALVDEEEGDPREAHAKEHGLSYISLDGNIGCVVNGAGLAMATMDIVKLYGGEPANFLDVGGSVTKEAAIEAFRIIGSEPKVKGILVNIFGGIARCDTIAEALIAAGEEVGFSVPVVVRLEGTNVERARALLDQADIAQLVTADDLTDAAKKVCAAI